eukprot:g46599.t1
MYGDSFKGKVVMVTGGAGYIGSHTTVLLLEQGASVIVVDNLINSSAESIKRVKEITGKAPQLFKVDMCHYVAFEKVFQTVGKIDAVIHMAGLKAVGESVSKPTLYYDNNLVSCLNLLKLMEKYGCFHFVFSSSATVYGLVKEMPVDETAPLGPTNPYGWTKMMQEIFLRDVVASDKRWKVILLRYFNPIGAHPSGRIGEDPQGIPNNLLPFVMQVAVGKLPKLNVFGDDWETPDGTGVRDYIHVVDLSEGHLAALANGVWKEMKNRCEVYNLGTGRGYSVLDVVTAAKKATGRPVPYEVAPRRPGDIGTCYSNPHKAETELKWKAKYGIDESVADGWRWQSNNPDGYAAKKGQAAPATPVGAAGASRQAQLSYLLPAMVGAVGLATGYLIGARRR